MTKTTLICAVWLAAALPASAVEVIDMQTEPLTPIQRWGIAWMNHNANIIASSSGQDPKIALEQNRADFAALIQQSPLYRADGPAMTAAALPAATARLAESDVLPLNKESHGGELKAPTVNFDGEKARRPAPAEPISNGAALGNAAPVVGPGSSPTGYRFSRPSADSTQVDPHEAAVLILLARLASLHDDGARAAVIKELVNPKLRDRGENAQWLVLNGLIGEIQRAGRKDFRQVYPLVHAIDDLARVVSPYDAAIAYAGLLQAAIDFREPNFAWMAAEAAGWATAAKIVVNDDGIAFLDPLIKQALRVARGRHPLTWTQRLRGLVKRVGR